MAFYIAIFLAGAPSATAEESAVKMAGEVLETKPFDSSARDRPGIELHMVLREAPSRGVISSRLSWLITSQSGTVIRTSSLLPSDDRVPEIITSLAPLNPSEMEEVMSIATNLLRSVESDNYRGWSGPLYGLDFRLVLPSERSTFSWKNWSSNTNILNSTSLAATVLRLRLIASNATTRLRGENKGQTFCPDGADRRRHAETSGDL